MLLILSETQTVIFFVELPQIMLLDLRCSHTSSNTSIRLRSCDIATLLRAYSLKLRWSAAANSTNADFSKLVYG